MAANLCPSRLRVNVEILSSACNSPDELGLSGKNNSLWLKFQNCVEQSTLTDGYHLDIKTGLETNGSQLATD